MMKCVDDVAVLCFAVFILSGLIVNVIYLSTLYGVASRVITKFIRRNIEKWEHVYNEIN